MWFLVTVYLTTVQLTTVNRGRLRGFGAGGSTMQCALFFVLVIVNHALIPVGWWVGVGGGSAHVFGRNGALSRVTGDRCLSGAWAIFTKVEGDVWLGTLLYVCVRDESNRS